MAQTLFLVDKLLEELDVLRQQVRQRPWRELNREAFVYTLRRTIEGMESMVSQLEAIHASFRENPQPGHPDVEENLKELHAALGLFKRNLKLEESKPLIDEHHFKESESHAAPELYASLEDKAVTVLTHTAFLCERLNLHSRRQIEAPSAGLRGAPRNVLNLLEQKEDELQGMRNKYEALRNKTFFGAMAEESTASLEREISDLNARLHAEKAVLERELENFNHTINSLLDKQLEFDRRMQAMADLYAEHARKASELNSLVKRERDLAKKILLDSEQDMAHLRATYSKELLRMDEAKQLARKDGREEAQQELERLKHALKEKDGLLADYRKMLGEREKALSRLKEKVPDWKR